VSATTRIESEGKMRDKSTQSVASYTETTAGRKTARTVPERTYHEAEERRASRACFHFDRHYLKMKCIVLF